MEWNTNFDGGNAAQPHGGRRGPMSGDTQHKQYGTKRDNFVPGKVYLGGLDPSTSKEMIRAYAEEWGGDLEGDVHYQPGKNYAFIVFKNPEDAVHFLNRKEHYLNQKKIEARAASPKGEDLTTAKVFVGGVPQSVTDDELREHFSRFGPYKECALRMDPQGKSKGFGFVLFEDPRDVDKCLVIRHYLGGVEVDVKRALPSDRDQQGGRQGGNRDGGSMGRQGGMGGGGARTGGRGTRDNMGGGTGASTMANMGGMGAMQGMNPAMMPMMNPAMMQQFMQMMAAQMAGGMGGDMTGMMGGQPGAGLMANPVMMGGFGGMPGMMGGMDMTGAGMMGGMGTGNAPSAGTGGGGRASRPNQMGNARNFNKSNNPY